MIPNKIVTIFIAAVLTVGTVYLGILSWNAAKAHNYIGISAEQQHSISINGEGKVTGIPDIAIIKLGYNAEKKSVAEAQKDNTEKMNAMIDKLKNEFKIETKDIATENYSISPQYDWTSGKQVLRGYSVSQTIRVKIRDLSKISQIIDAAGSLGLNQVNALVFEIDEPEKLKEQAREEAMKQAKEKANALAEIAGVKLGRIISFRESANDSQPIPVYDNYVRLESAKAVSSPSIEAGSSEIIINILVEYEIL